MSSKDSKKCFKIRSCSDDGEVIRETNTLPYSIIASDIKFLNTNFISKIEDNSIRIGSNKDNDIDTDKPYIEIIDSSITLKKNGTSISLGDNIHIKIPDVCDGDIDIKEDEDDGTKYLIIKD